MLVTSGAEITPESDTSNSPSLVLTLSREVEIVEIVVELVEIV